MTISKVFATKNQSFFWFFIIETHGISVICLGRIGDISKYIYAARAHNYFEHVKMICICTVRKFSCINWALYLHVLYWVSQHKSLIIRFTLKRQKLQIVVNFAILNKTQYKYVCMTNMEPWIYHGWDKINLGRIRIPGCQVTPGVSQYSKSGKQSNL